MCIKQIKRRMAGLSALIFTLMSLSAEAKIEQFQESYTGYLPMEYSLDGVYYVGEQTFSNCSATLTLYYEALSLLQDQLYVVFGSYSRNQGLSLPLGQFDFSLSAPDPITAPDPAFSALPIAGSFYFQDILMMPDGQLEVFYSEFGLLKGFLSPQNALSFTIDWTIYTRDRRTLVPAPPTTWLFGTGLVCLAWVAFRRQRPAPAWPIANMHF